MKKLITLLMIVLLLAGCSGRKSDKEKPAVKPDTTISKPDEQDPYKRYYGTWRTSAVEYDGTRFSMEQIEALGGKEQCDVIFVIAENGIIHGYSFYDGNTVEISWSKKI